MKKYGFGVDIGGTTCKIGLFETTGVLVEKWEIPTRKENSGENVLPDVAVSIEKKMEEKKIGKEDLQGIGIGVPGPVTSQGVVQCCVNLGWGQVNVAEVMEKRMGCKIKVGNDANVAALGEMWQGGGKGHRNVVMVTLGTGVGGGIIVDGKIVAEGKSDISWWTRRKQKPAAVENGAVWNSMLLPQEWFVWQRGPLHPHRRRQR